MDPETQQQLDMLQQAEVDEYKSVAAQRTPPRLPSTAPRSSPPPA